MRDRLLLSGCRMGTRGSVLPLGLASPSGDNAAFGQEGSDGMIALIQRVSEASVRVDGQVVGAIGPGLLVLLGVERGDDKALAERLLHKVSGYRVFGDEQGKMNLNVQQAGGSLLVVSQFTLAAETKKGMRPTMARPFSFSNPGRCVCMGKAVRARKLPRPPAMPKSFFPAGALLPSRA